MTPLPPPVIFLDIDGVLNITRMVRRTGPVRLRKDGRPYRITTSLERERRWSKEAVAQINRLLFFTRAVLVLSSSWRLQPDARDTLASLGVIGPWHAAWRTEELAAGRGAEITRWLQVNGEPRHVIIDDWPRELSAHRARLVLVSDMAGLSHTDANAARDILIAQSPRERERHAVAAAPA